MRALRAVLAALVLVVLLVAPPILLVHFIGNPWPAGGVGWNSPLSDGAIIGLLAVVVWVLWAQLVFCTISETISAIRGTSYPARTPLTFDFQRHLVRRLITTIVVAAVATPVAGAMLNTATAADTESSSQTNPLTPIQQRLSAPVTQPSQTSQAGQSDVKTPAAQQQGDREGHRVAVQRGDSLWSLAERHLGSGDRWKELAQANEGRQMNDRRTFHAAGVIRPGWDLLLPAGVTPKTDPAAASNGVDYTVQAGDTLSEISQDHLGDAALWPRVAQDNHLANPDLIHPGDQLDLTVSSERHDAADPQPDDTTQNDPNEAPEAGAPDAAAPLDEQPTPDTSPADPIPQDEQTTPATPEHHEVPEEADAPSQEWAGALPGLPGIPQPNSPENTASTSTQGASQLDEAESGTSTGEADAEEDAGEQWLPAVGGVGGILAAGFLGWVSLRRRRQNAQRPPFGSVPMPEDPYTQRTERQVRSVEDPISVEYVDQALRGLGLHCATTATPLPDVKAARLTADQFDLYLGEPALLPAPWQAPGTAVGEPGTVWVLHRSQELPHLEEVAGVPAPWPALVTIGQDLEEQGHILLNLEHVEQVAITGPRDQTRAALTAMSLELTQSRWAENVAVSIVGSMSELIGLLGREHTRYVPTALNVLADPAEQQTEIMLVDGTLSQRQRAQVEEHNATTGRQVCSVESADSPSAAVTSWRIEFREGNTGALIGMGHTADGTPTELPIAIQVIDTDTYNALIDIMFTATEPPIPPADTTQRPGAGRDGGRAAGLRVVTNEPAERPETPGPVGEELPVGGVMVDPTSPVPRAGRPESGGSTAVLDREVKPEESTTTPEPGQSASTSVGHDDDVLTRLISQGPLIRLLRPVPALLGARGELNSSTHEDLCVEIAAWMALNPGLTRTALLEAVWNGRRVQKNTVDSAVSRTRTWLGANPTGEKYLPARKHTLDPAVRTDWDVFTDLVGDDPRGASTAALEEAISLVEGRILDGVPARTYTWIEADREEIISLIVDSCYELGRRRLMEGRWRDVERAASRGVLIEPGSEALWRVWILATHSSGNPPAVAEAQARMHARISDLGYELAPETTDLINALESLDDREIEAARQSLLA